MVDSAQNTNSLTKSFLSVLNISTSIQISMRMDDVALECMMGEAVEIVPYFNNVHLAVVAGLNGGNVLTSLVFLVKHWLQELGKPRLSV